MNHHFIGTRRAVVALCLGLLVVALGALSASAAGPCTSVCYADAVGGNDANDGDTPATAKKTIQAAVNQVTAGGQVYVLDGLYPEAVTVNKAVTITGNGPANTTVDPTSGNGFGITASNVTIEDLKITDAAQGARLSGTISDITFDNVHFVNNTSRGIEMQNGAGLLISNVEVLNSLFDNNNLGIRMSSTTTADGILIENTTFQNHVGSGFQQSNDGSSGWVTDLTVRDSTFTNNGTSSGYAGVYAEEFSNVLIEDSTFTGNRYGINLFDWYSVAASTTTNVVIQNNTFTDHKMSTMALRSTTSNPVAQLFRVDNNTINQNVGALLGATQAHLAVTTSSANPNGAVDVIDNDLTFSGTFLLANSATYGIYLAGRAEDVEVEGNTINGGGVGTNGATIPSSGIRLATSTFQTNANVDISKNLINNFVNGVSIHDGSNVMGGVQAASLININRNDLSNNSGYGIQSGPGAESNGQCNWWGAADGPGPVGAGSGSNVSANVKYPVWLFANNLNGGNVTNTDTGEVFCSIQEGIDDSDTLDGHTLVASAGVYLEQVVIYKSVELVGAGAATTFIQAPATMPAASNPDSTIVKVTGAGVSAEIHDFTITGPGPTGCGSILAGIFVRDGAYANIHDNTISDVRDTGLSGCQNGIGIYVGRQSLATTGTADITNNTIKTYQKAGIVVDNTGSQADIVGNTITGEGPLTYIAENGIQVSRGASAEINGNTVSGHSYSPFSYVATGIFIWGAGTTNTDGNTISENQVGVYVIDTDGTHKNNTISATSTGTGSPGFWGMIVDAPPPTHVPQPVDGDAAAAPSVGPNSPAPEQTVLVTGNTFTSDNSAGGVGLEADAGYGSYDIDLTATKNIIHNWEYGVYVLECSSGCTGTDFANVAINRNSIVGNTEYGMFADTLTPVTDGTCNWWGDMSGPSEEGPGTGDKVGVDIDHDPWLYTSDLNGPCHTGGTIAIDKVAAGGGATVFEFDLSWSGTNVTLTDAAAPYVTAPPLQAGNYAVTEVNFPTGWSQQSATCDNTTTTPVETVSPSFITVADGDAWVCTFTNIYTPPPANICTVPTSNLYTDILGKGMGSPKKHKTQMKMTIPNYASVDSLYGQLVAKNSGHANYVRFVLPGKNNWVQVNTITSPAAQQAGNFWYGDYIPPAKTVTGRWFLQTSGTKNHIPRAMVLYPTYESATNTYVNIWNTYDAAEAEVYWDTALGWTPTQVITESIAPPNAPTTFNVELALVDNDKDARPVWVTVEAGGVTQTQTPNNPSAGDQLNLMTFTLAGVPAGTDKITITVYSPSVALDGVEGDSAMLVGMAANYMCAPLD